MGWLDRLLGRDARRGAAQPQEAVLSEPVRFRLSERIYPLLLAGLETAPELGELHRRIVEGQPVYGGYDLTLSRAEAQELYNAVIDVLDQRVRETKERLRAPMPAMSPMQMREYTKALHNPVQDWQEVVQAIISQVPRDLRPQGPPPEVWG